VSLIDDVTPDKFSCICNAYSLSLMTEILLDNNHKGLLCIAQCAPG